MPQKKASKVAPPAGHREAVEEALAASGWSEEELARRLNLSPATLKRVRKGYQPIRSASLSVLQEIILASNSSRGEGATIDLARLRELASYLSSHRDLLPQLKILLDRQDLR